MAPNPTSHYVPYFTVEESAAYNRHGQPSRRLRAACGECVDYPREHSAEPDCQTCLRYLQAEAVDESKSAEDDLFGEPYRGAPVQLPTIDVLAGYRPKGSRR